MIKRNTILFTISFCFAFTAHCMQESTQQESLDLELIKSITFKHMHRTRQMLKAGANPNATYKGQSALAWNEQHGTNDICTLLKQYGAREDHAQIESNRALEFIKSFANKVSRVQ